MTVGQLRGLDDRRQERLVYEVKLGKLRAELRWQLVEAGASCSVGNSATVSS